MTMILIGDTRAEKPHCSLIVVWCSQPLAKSRVWYRLRIGFVCLAVYTASQSDSNLVKRHEKSGVTSLTVQSDQSHCRFIERALSSYEEFIIIQKRVSNTGISLRKVT